MMNGGPARQYLFEDLTLIALGRDFLVFSPTTVSNLEDAFSYYSRTLRTAQDGDTFISEEAIEHLGRFSHLSYLFPDVCLSLRLIRSRLYWKTPNAERHHFLCRPSQKHVEYADDCEIYRLLRRWWYCKRDFSNIDCTI